MKGATTLELDTTRDIVATIDRTRRDRIIVGFAAETGNPVEKARGKLERKKLDLIVANDVTAEGAGFDVETNIVTLVDASGATSLPMLDKDDVADAILDRVSALRAERTRPARTASRPRGKVTSLARARRRR